VGTGADGAGGADSADAAAGHRNLIAYSRALSSWGSRGGCVEEAGVVAYAGGSWIPVIGNGAFRVEDTVAADRVIAVADAWFAVRGHGYSIKVRDTGQDDDLRAACEAHGLAAFGDPEPQMICHHPLPVPEPAEGVRLVEVTDRQGVADFAAVNRDAYATYGMPEDVMTDLFDRPDAVLDNQDTVIVVAYRDDEPLATALTYLSDGVAGLQWVGTRPEARRMRLGATVTVWATNVAFERGATSCTLQASPMGGPLYLKLGYVTQYHYREHVRWKGP
jgi:hypothetical protein